MTVINLVKNGKDGMNDDEAYFWLNISQTSVSLALLVLTMSAGTLPINNTFYKKETCLVIILKTSGRNCNYSS